MATTTGSAPGKFNQETEQAQHHQPGHEHEMTNKPRFIRDNYRGAGKLAGRKALITGGDSGIGRAVAVHFAREGADVAIVHLEEDVDARDTRELIEKEGAQCLVLRGDVGDPAFCEEAVAATVEKFGVLDILVNNAAEQHSVERLEDITPEQVEATFRTNVFGYFNMLRAATPRMKKGSRVINTSSVTAHRGSAHLIDYSATKGAIESLTRSAASQLAERSIYVNCVAPGPIWTPLIPATFPTDALKEFGKDVLLKRPGQPCEVATCFVFLASEDSSYITGQTIHVNGGGYLGI